MPLARRRPESPEARAVRNRLNGPKGMQTDPHIWRIARIGECMEVLFTVPDGARRKARTALLWSDGSLDIEEGWGA